MRIEREAGDWLVRFSDPGVDLKGRQAFELWLAMDPRHGESYDALSRTWEDIGALKSLARLVEAEPPVPAWRGFSRALVGAVARPGAISGGLIAAAAAALGFMFLLPLHDRPDYSTEIAELRAIALPDGSRITLGAHSAIDVDFSEAERRVVLRSGEAFFEVVRNPDRPFYVEAGGAMVRVVGTKFDVRRGERGTGVSVLEGVVAVSNRGDPVHGGGDYLRVLRAGERLDVRVLDAPFASARPLPFLVEASAAPAGAWREGRLSYNDAPLVELVADVNRYYAPGVRLSSREVGQLRVTAAFRADQIPEFLDALEMVLPVEVSQRPDRSFAVDARERR